MKAENKLVALKRFVELFQSEIDLAENGVFFDTLKNKAIKEIIINKYDNPVYISKAGTVILLKEQDTVELGEYFVEGPNSVVVDMGLSLEDAVALGEKIILTEVKNIVGFKETDYYEGAAQPNMAEKIDLTKFATIEPKEEAVFKCACGNLVGLHNIARTCQLCHTKVIKELPKTGDGVEIIDKDIVTKNGGSSPSKEKKEDIKIQDAETAKKIVDSIINESHDEVTYVDGKPVDPNGVIINDDKEDYYGIRVLTEDNRFISPDIEDYNNNYDALMDFGNPIFIVANGKYTHIRGYNTVEETERLAIAEEHRQAELLGNVDEILEIVENNNGDEDTGAFGEKPKTNITIISGDKKPKINLVSGEKTDVEVTGRAPLRLKGANGTSSTIETGVPVSKFKLGITTNDKNDSKSEVAGGTSIFGRVREVSDLDI